MRPQPLIPGVRHPPGLGRSFAHRTEEGCNLAALTFKLGSRCHHRNPQWLTMKFPARNSPALSDEESGLQAPLPQRGPGRHGGPGAAAPYRAAAGEEAQSVPPGSGDTGRPAGGASLQRLRQSRLVAPSELRPSLLQPPIGAPRRRAGGR